MLLVYDKRRLHYSTSAFRDPLITQLQAAFIFHKTTNISTPARKLPQTWMKLTR
ncbi:hypothetical protein [Candidatus Vallotia lariciata]|uniref:hypothetical protein n=1 Tax=Candidatus Vallotia laricis TaxID=2018052 RepID=UPI001D015D25|nr:hypothetical protein [Candidatus Vallotia lariciata]